MLQLPEPFFRLVKTVSVPTLHADECGTQFANQTKRLLLSGNGFTLILINTALQCGDRAQRGGDNRFNGNYIFDSPNPIHSGCGKERRRRGIQ
jgi:hypothetical protein